MFLPVLLFFAAMHFSCFIYLWKIDASSVARQQSFFDALRRSIDTGHRMGPPYIDTGHRMGPPSIDTSPLSILSQVISLKWYSDSGFFMAKSLILMDLFRRVNFLSDRAYFTYMVKF